MQRLALVCLRTLRKLQEMGRKSNKCHLKFVNIFEQILKLPIISNLMLENIHKAMRQALAI